MHTKKIIITVAIVVVVMLLGVTSCSPGDIKAFQGILKQVDGVSGNVTVTMKDGTSVTFNLDDIELNTEDWGECPEPGDNVTIEKDKSGKIKRVKVCYAEIQGTVKGISGDNVTITTAKNGDITLQVTPKTMIIMAGKNFASFTDLAVGQRVTAKYEKETNQAIKIIVHLEKTEAEIQGTIKSITGDNVTITTAKNGNITLFVTTDTRILTTDNNNATIAGLAVGQKVTARYEISTNKAIKIIVHVAKPVVKYTEVQGTIKDISGDNVTIATIKNGDITVHLTADTMIISTANSITANTSLTVGQKVNVKYETETKNAVKIFIYAEKQVTQYEEIQGTIKYISGDNVTITTLKKGDITVIVTPETRIIIGTNGSATIINLAVGQKVTAKYETGTKKAAKIMVIIEKPVIKYEEIQGTIKYISGDNVTIATTKKGDITLRVTSGTVIVIGASSNATVSDLAVGQSISAKYEISSKTAVKIIVKIEKVIREIQGWIQAIGSDNRSVAIGEDDTEFVVLNITPETLIKIVDLGVGSAADLDIGQKAEAKYYADTMNAIKIYIYIEET